LTVIFPVPLSTGNEVGEFELAPSSLRGEQEDEPVAKPGRPTVSTPAKITPVGYLQLETGVLAATRSLEFSSRSSLNEAIKFSVATRLELIAVLEPLVHYRAGDRAANGTAEIFRRPSNSFQRRGSAADSRRQLLSSRLRRRRAGTGSWQPAKPFGGSGQRRRGGSSL